MADIPKIRFKGFTEPWEQRKLGHLCERVTRKNKNNESDLPLTIASQYGLIDQRDFFNKVVAAKDMSNYYLLKKGEFAYNKSYSKGFDYGSIKRLNAYEQGCLSTLYICFGITSDDVESDYLECFFDTLKWYSDITMICAEGARNHGLLNVDTKAFFDEVTISMPSSKKEQRIISAYLNNLDHLITLHQRKYFIIYNKLITWEQRKFGELYSKVSEKNDLSFGADKIISVANMYFKEEVKESSDEYMRTYNVMRLGDIAFEGNKSKNYSHGRFVENTIGDGIVSHVFDVFRPTTSYDLLFWKYLINNEGVMGRIMARCTNASTMMTNLVASDFLKEKILVPSLKEQKKIGAYFDSLDHLITLHRRAL